MLAYPGHYDHRVAWIAAVSADTGFATISFFQNTQNWSLFYVPQAETLAHPRSLLFLVFLAPWGPNYRKIDALGSTWWLPFHLQALSSLAF